MPKGAAELALPPALPLVQRFPELARLPRAQLCNLPTPVVRVALPGGRELLVKRDDLSADPVGGNKARGLEWLLGAVHPGDRLVTVGPTGSNHALATSIHARKLGAIPEVIRWSQWMNPAAAAVDARLRDLARVTDAGSVPVAYALAMARRLAGARWIPAGGATPLAILGHVNAALELADQLHGDSTQRPTRIFVPLGTGGTAAGLALGFRMAGLEIPIVAVRVVPRLIGRARRVAGHANRTAALIESITGRRQPRLRPQDISVVHGFQGAAYGAPLDSRDLTQAAVAAGGIRLDDTYSLKACAAALASSDARPLLWLTFDGRILSSGAPPTQSVEAP